MNTPEALPDLPAYNAALRSLVEGVNGAVYAGDRLNAVVDAVRWLRAHPQVALYLLGLRVDICGDPSPFSSLFRCTRPPGHPLPHMDAPGATWGHTDEQLKEIVRLSR